MPLNTFQYVEQYKASRLYTQNGEVKAAVDSLEDRLRAKPNIPIEEVATMIEGLYGLVARVLNRSGNPPGTEPDGAGLEGNPALNPYYQFLEGLGLSEGDKEKLKKIPLGYNDAIAIARKQAQNPNLPVPTLEKTIQEIMKMPIDVLKEVAKFGKPTLLMTPPNTMAEKEAAMNAYKPYVEEGNTDNNQADMYFREDKNSDLWGPKPDKLHITITDGKPTMPQLSNELLSKKWGDRYKAVHADLKGKKLRMITAHEYAGLEQMSLMNYERARSNATHPNHSTPEKEIVDFYVSGQNEVITAFYQPEDALTNLQKIPYGYFDSGFRQIYFYWDTPSGDVESLRFRPSVQVFEF